MVTSQFFVAAQHGITGGFAPPQPRAIHTISLAQASPSLLITSATADKDSMSLADGEPKPLDLGHSDTTALVDELYSILKEIPTEQPPGNEDIYGLDIGIAWRSDDLEWVNWAPEGCGGGFSSTGIQPTEEERIKFGRAVEIINVLVGKVSNSL